MPRSVHYRLPLPVYQMTLVVEWLPEAEWDEHWAVTLLGPEPERRQQIARRCTFTEAKTLAHQTLQAVLHGEAA